MTPEEIPDGHLPKLTLGTAQWAAPMAEADVISGLRDALDTLNAQWEAQLAKAKGDHKDKLTRPNVTALLKVIADHLAPALYQQHEPLDGHPVSSDHDAVAVLLRFIDALEDIDIRGRHDLFAPPPADLTTPASLATDELKRDRAIIQLVSMVQVLGGLKLRKDAETQVAEMFMKNNVKLRDKTGRRTVAPTQKKLRSLFDADKKRR